MYKVILTNSATVEMWDILISLLCKKNPTDIFEPRNQSILIRCVATKPLLCNYTGKLRTGSKNGVSHIL